MLDLGPLVGTAVLAVAGSLLAADPQQAGNWTLAIGAVHVMYVGDVIGAFEVEARELARTSSQKLERARIDILDTHGPGRLIVLTLAGLLLIFVGFVLRLPAVGRVVPFW